MFVNKTTQEPWHSKYV